MSKNLNKDEQKMVSGGNHYYVFEDGAVLVFFHPNGIALFPSMEGALNPPVGTPPLDIESMQRCETGGEYAASAEAIRQRFPQA